MGNWIGNVRHTIPNVWHVCTSLIECGFHKPCAVTVIPLVPHRDYSEAHLLHRWIGLEPVYAQSGNLAVLRQTSSCTSGETCIQPCKCTFPIQVLGLGNTTLLISIPISILYFQATWPCGSIQYRTIPIPVLRTITLEPGIGSIDTWYLVSPSTTSSCSNLVESCTDCLHPPARVVSDSRSCSSLIHLWLFRKFIHLHSVCNDNC